MGACASVPIDLKNAKAPEPAKEETEPAAASNEQEDQVKTEEVPKEEKPVTSSDEVSILPWSSTLKAYIPWTDLTSCRMALFLNLGLPRKGSIHNVPSVFLSGLVSPE